MRDLQDSLAELRVERELGDHGDDVGVVRVHLLLHVQLGQGHEGDPYEIVVWQVLLQA